LELELGVRARKLGQRFFASNVIAFDRALG
jgi:hypothetical protein